MKPVSKVAGGLFVSWAIHDLEELLTMRATSKRVLPLLPAWVPIPSTWRRDGMPQATVTLAIAMMAVLVAIASGQGIRSGGRSWIFRAALVGHGLHGFAHLASAAALRGYSTGVVTAPVVVIPYWLWARRVLKAHGISDLADGTLPGGLAIVGTAVPAALGVAHVLEAAASARRDRATGTG